MLRLKDQTDSRDPAVARAAALLAATRPLDGDRLWPRALPPLDAPARAKPFAFRGALVLGLSLASVVAAAATALPRAQWWAAPWSVAHSVTGVPDGADSRSAANRASGVSPGAALVAKEPAADSEPAFSGPPALPPSLGAGGSRAPTALVPVAAAGTPTRLTAPGAHGGSAPSTRAATSESAREADDESALMVEAVRALRRDRDPARALSLSEVALERYPRGAQVEEAMALGMEAANAVGDSATARRLAERYLATFRAGRFADRAQQIVSPAQR